MKKYTVLAIMLFVAACVFVSPSQALRITLKRVVFEGAKRAEVVTIINNSDEAKTYRLGWRHFRMTPEKSLVAIPDDELTPDIKPVVDMVRFAPRRFTVPPNSSQQVRMMLRMSGDVPDGEYRSHLWVRPEADVEELRAKAVEDNKKSGSKSGVSLTMLAGVTMPVIVRKGSLDAQVSVANTQARESGGFLDVGFSLQREGSKSVYGDLDYVCNPGNSDEYFLKSTRGIAIYAEASHRNFNLRIERPLDEPACRSLSVTFTETLGFDGDKAEILGQQIVQVSQ